MHRVVPELIIENFRAGRYSGEFQAVGMFLDLSGFSTMTDALMQHGQHGAEVLAGLMHSVFDPLVESIFEYGGKIVGFAGDGIMALYPIETDERHVAKRALASAHVIQRQLETNHVRTTVYGTFPITAKIGLALGSVSWRIMLSDDGGQATYYFRGSAVNDSAEAEHNAKSGTILLAPKLAGLLREEILSESIGSFHRYDGFRSELPQPEPATFPPMDVEVARLFMPEEVISLDMRGEFRQVVNLFMRFPDLPDETLKDFMTTVFSLRDRYGGLLTRLDFGDKGCNMLMLWGAPVAYENDIGRALNFLIDLKSDVDFPITAGVTYYIAHAGYLGSGMCEDYTCYGWGVNLASRLMMTAPESAVWIDERVARRVKNRFDFEYQGAQSFKGFSAEQKVYSLTGRKSQEVFHQGEQVGREAELAQLVESVRPLWEGNFAGLTVIWGDAGIGKSRLVYELKDLHEREKRNVLWALCHSDQILRYSFNPFRYWLLRYFRLDSRMDDEQKKRAFDSKLNDLISTVDDPELAGELGHLRTVLGALLDLYWTGSFYESLDAEGRYNSTLAVLIAMIKAESLCRPMLIFLEDAQFLDDDSRAFLPRLKRALSMGSVEYPVAILISSRHTGAGDLFSGELTDHSIVLGALSTQALASLSEIQLGGIPSPDLVQLLETRSEGNPYFADQFLIYLQEEKLLEMGNVGWRLKRQLQEASLPADIRALLVARLDQLTRNVRDVIQTAAVLGREFEVLILAEMLHDDTFLAEEIAEAEKADIWSALNQLKYIFSHGLLRDAAYAMQMRARRMELHALALDALERIHADEIEHHYGELAYHSEHARIRDKALDYLWKAGKASANSYQNTQALDYFTRALSFVPPDDLLTRYDLAVERVEIYSRMGKRDLHRQELVSLDGLARQLNDPERVAKVQMLRSAYSYFMGDYRESISYAEQSSQCSESLANSDLALYTRVVWSMSYLHLGELDKAMQLARNTLEYDRRLGNRKEQSRILNAMGWIAMEQNKADDARVYLAEALEIAREINDPAMECRALNHLAKLEGDMNTNFALALQYYESAFKIAHKIGERFMEVAALANLGFSAGMQGDFDVALVFHQRALDLAREMGDLSREASVLVNLSAMAGILDQAEPALQYAQRSLELSKKISDQVIEGWATLYIGHAYQLLGDREAARDSYRRSIEIRNSLGQTTLSMEPLSGLVETYLATGDLAAASPHAEMVLEFLKTKPNLEGTDEPLRVYNTCYRYLVITKDPRATQILQTAKDMLNAQASRFVDEVVRERYVENIPWRRAIRGAEIPA